MVGRIGEGKKEGREEGGRGGKCRGAIWQFGALSQFNFAGFACVRPSFLPSAFSLPLPVQGAPYGRGKAFGKSLVDVPPAGGPTL